MIVSVDPGLLFFFFALWSGEGELLAAELVDGYASTHKSIEWLEMGRAVARRVAVGVDELVIERPKIYGAFSKHKGDQNDLIDIAAVVGVICAKVEAVKITTYLPSEWKGSTPKKVTETKAKEALTEKELGKVRLPQKSLAHNVWDSIGLGLAHFKKLGIRCSQAPAWKPPAKASK